MNIFIYNFSMLLAFFAPSYVVFGQQENCYIPSKGGLGQCKSIFKCQSLLSIVNQEEKTLQEKDLLYKSYCGIDDDAPAVCCPKQNETKPCLTPVGKPGECISLYSCPQILTLLRHSLTNDIREFLQRSQCAGTDQYGVQVCCGPVPSFDVVKGNCELTAFPPDPKTECCGVAYQGKIVDNGYLSTGGNATAIDQYPWLVRLEFNKNGQQRVFGMGTLISGPTPVDSYPWLVLIEYIKDGVVKTLCGGALISSKYVLTAAHCVTGPVLRSGTPTSIRLGEYDTSHQGRDCVIYEAASEECSDGAISIPIEEMLPHPQYNPSSTQKRDDIALIKMTQLAPYTDFIRPICLPTFDPTQGTVGFNTIVAGWGAVSSKQTSSNVKLWNFIPLVSRNVCQPAYAVPGRSSTLWKGQFCAGGEKGKDSCIGDSGGPFMSDNGRIFELIGVNSFGPIPCDLENIPGVYTNVYEYNTWIRSKISP